MRNQCARDSAFNLGSSEDFSLESPHVYAEYNDVIKVSTFASFVDVPSEGFVPGTVGYELVPIASNIIFM